MSDKSGNLAVEYPQGPHWSAKGITIVVLKYKFTEPGVSHGMIKNHYSGNIQSPS